MPKSKDNNLKRVARRLGVGAAALSVAGGVQKATVYTHLSGKAQPGVTVALGYCALFQRVNSSYPAGSRPFQSEQLTPNAIFMSGKRKAA